MARFYTSVTNSRGGTTTAQGTKQGQTAHIRGWDVGVKIDAGIDNRGRDTFIIYRTSGSHSKTADEVVGWINEDGFTAADQ
jgi:hypothetical protein